VILCSAKDRVCHCNDGELQHRPNAATLTSPLRSFTPALSHIGNPRVLLASRSSANMEDALVSNPLISDTRASDTSPQIQLHPLVLLTISDYITRHTLRNQEGPIVGAILGLQNGRELTMEVAFECQTTYSNGQYLMHHEWFNGRLEQCKSTRFRISRTLNLTKSQTKMSTRSRNWILWAGSPWARRLVRSLIIYQYTRSSPTILASNQHAS